MAGTLEKNGFDVRILDCPLDYQKVRSGGAHTIKVGTSLEDILGVVDEYRPDIVGVSCAYTMYESDSFEVIDLIKQHFPGMLVVVGGAHSSANPAHVLRNRNIDLVVIGEGEETLLEIATRRSNRQNLSDVCGTALQVDGQVKVNAPREYIQNLDDYQAAWHLIDMQKYYAHPFNSNATMRQNAVDIVTSRGCPGTCSFCSIHTVWGRKWRARSAGNVVDEIEMLYRQYGARQFRIQDDNLTLDKKRMLDICDEIVKRKLDIRWDTPNGIALWTLSKEVLQKMKHAGCYRVTFGVESGCLRTQKYIGKIVPLDRVNELIDFCHKIGMWVCSTFIIGFPEETEDDIRETESYILRSKINFPFIYVAQPFMGTKMSQDFERLNLLKHGLLEASEVGFSRYDTLHFSGEELNKRVKNIYLKFYLRKMISFFNPARFYREFLSKIRSSEDIRYVAKMFGEIWFPLFRVIRWGKE
jgi:magnesium-protoporphyrin IX monomethyl ester (oxidative) cyclase